MRALRRSHLVFQEPTEVHKERPPQQIVNRKRTMNSDFYDLRQETPDEVWFTVLNCFHISIIYSQIYHFIT
jgi:hypothetical protein